MDTARRGLLFVGTVGLGKTHLAVGVLQRLVRERGARGLFCDYRELLKNIQNSYNPQVNDRTGTAEADLRGRGAGAGRPGRAEAERTGVGHGSPDFEPAPQRQLSTIITTNYADLPVGGGAKTDAEVAARASLPWVTGSAIECAVTGRDVCALEMRGWRLRHDRWGGRGLGEKAGTRE